MHYAKIERNGEEKWLSVDRAHDNPVPLNDISLSWALHCFLKKFKNDGWLLFVSTGTC